MKIKGIVLADNDSKPPGLILTIERQMQGQGNLEFVCGNCDGVLGHKLQHSVFKSNSPVRCPKCEKWNQWPPSSELPPE